MYVFDFCALYEYEMAQDIKSYLNTDFSPFPEENNNIKNIKNANCYDNERITRANFQRENF